MNGMQEPRLVRRLEAVEEKTGRWTKPGEIQAPAFVLTDRNGKVRATLGIDDHGNPGLTMTAPDGRAGATLALDGNGASRLVLRDEKNERIAVGLDENGEAAVEGVAKDGQKFRIDASSARHARVGGAALFVALLAIAGLIAAGFIIYDVTSTVASIEKRSVESHATESTIQVAVLPDPKPGSVEQPSTESVIYAAELAQPRPHDVRRCGKPGCPYLCVFYIDEWVHVRRSAEHLADRGWEYYNSDIKLWPPLIKEYAKTTEEAAEKIGYGYPKVPSVAGTVPHSEPAETGDGVGDDMIKFAHDQKRCNACLGKSNAHSLHIRLNSACIRGSRKHPFYVASWTNWRRQPLGESDPNGWYGISTDLEDGTHYVHFGGDFRDDVPESDWTWACILGRFYEWKPRRSLGFVLRGAEILTLDEEKDRRLYGR